MYNNIVSNSVSKIVSKIISKIKFKLNYESFAKMVKYEDNNKQFRCLAYL